MLQFLDTADKTAEEFPMGKLIDGLSIPL